jgi:hypothetical protein
METVFQTTGNISQNTLSGTTKRRRLFAYWKEISSELTFEDKIELEQANDDIKNKRFTPHKRIMSILRSDDK